MRFSSLLAVASMIAGAVAHNIQLAAHSRECFHEQLHKDDRMTVTFQVGDREFQQAGNLNVDFWVGHNPCFEALSLKLTHIPDWQPSRRTRGEREGCIHG